MTNRERENLTLSFTKMPDRGAVEETFFPWALTVKSFEKEGLPSDILYNLLYSVSNLKGSDKELEKYLDGMRRPATPDSDARQPESGHPRRPVLPEERSRTEADGPAGSMVTSVRKTRCRNTVLED